MKSSLFSIFIFLFTLPIFAKNTIVIVGDSLSAGYGLADNKGWVMQLRERLNKEGHQVDVINSSISGDTTSNGLARLPELLARYKPNITIIQLGANDGLRGLQLSIIHKNLKKMIELAKQSGSQVLLIGLRLPPNYGPDYTQEFQNLFILLAKQYNVKVVPLFLDHVDDKIELLQSDRLHPNTNAQPILLENVWVVLKPMLSNSNKG